ncbi:sensor histidine kinase [Pseudobutyrivibrio xylanivorans]|uniref:histidine kinase n=1 Tax=Pseudobutyrivibrio xylanivorans TaxID=185007 RepID=A0A5P6VTT3_PSEXY|nr:HAMP domain-containing sensor histidine kinase [Pseudobutyrivibrio xylanivorans]QFJ56046.1 HAMP domain-containing histidine kinase [Pseudobutyrivibrio xylanivorans]
MKNDFKTPELSVSDLTQSLYEVSKKLQQANRDLQAHEEDMALFYANISHDLRSPITAISNGIEYLQSNEDNISKGELHDTLKVMSERTKYLTQLINDIFLMASLDTPSLSVHTEPVNLRFFLEDYFYMNQVDVAYEGCDLELKLSDAFIELNPFVMLDPHLIARALDNLFTNAVKYCDDKPKIILGADIIDDGSLVVFVRDNGIGIDAKNIEKIFDRGYRVDASRTPGADNGCGFGLSIVKSIVECHGGSITCESTLGEGTEFRTVFSIDRHTGTLG